VFIHPGPRAAGQPIFSNINQIGHAKTYPINESYDFDGHMTEFSEWFAPCPIIELEIYHDFEYS